MTTLFWNVFWPFKARSLKNSRRLKWTYIAGTALSFVIPIEFVVATMAHFAVEVKNDPVFINNNITFVSGGMGYVNFRFPPVINCFSRDSVVTFYAFVLPINITAVIGITELILVFWKIVKVSCDRVFLMM